MHVKPYFDYKGGNISGFSYNSENAATSVVTFMINSISSSYKDVVHILPVNKIAADVLHAFIKKIIIGLENIGFKVICVVTDNNSVNQKAMSQFASPSQSYSILYPHPVNKERPLFFMIDTVHLLKNIRNNWINQKNVDKCMFYPNFKETTSEKNSQQDSSFKTLKLLYETEKNNIVKYAYNLSLKALEPNNLEKQNVKLVLKIFNKFIPESLMNLGEKYEFPHYKETAEYIRIINRWWDIVNVKTPFTGIRENNVYKKPLTSSETDKRYKFLDVFLNWLEDWKNMKCDTGMLTKETYSALFMTTYALKEITKYCQEEFEMKYILPGKFQTDNLEARFGLYRQMAGAQYHVSLRQVFESENKLRMHCILKICLKSNKHGNLELFREAVGENWEEFEKSISEKLPVFNILLTEEDFKKSEDVLPVLVYLGGYCVHTVLKKLKCSICKKFLTNEKELDCSTSLIQNLSRGKLLYPKKCIVNYLAAEIIFNSLVNEEQIHDYGECISGHKPENVYRMIIWSAVNSLLNNYFPTGEGSSTKTA
ncbi:uncharacterized protein LOC129959843 [Argiope bruennichi]|uniref:uncharacterized protein LOC129959843 n=1 Tax=Argiope bruennichi TaxID=94029 RepID=UPI002495154F|nr:uncharacterized protein LOC129959843 [Argiope bruennichi]